MVTWELGGELGTTYFDRFRDHTLLPLLAGGWLGVLAGSCWEGLSGAHMRKGWHKEQRAPTKKTRNNILNI